MEEQDEEYPEQVRPVELHPRSALDELGDAGEYLGDAQTQDNGN